jgi:hypothetical protein
MLAGTARPTSSRGNEVRNHFQCARGSAACFPDNKMVPDTISPTDTISPHHFPFILLHTSADKRSGGVSGALRGGQGRETGHGLSTRHSLLVTCHSSLGTGSSCPAAGPSERAGKSRTGIRRPLGPATDGSRDPSSDGLLDTRALTAREKPMTGCLRLAHQIYWRHGITGRRV